uniref:ornithine carbamoyltransferase n=1 Tax=Macrostomum lignano TaxID=282301 RepID=A0A1I8FME9_9PLAT
DVATAIAHQRVVSLAVVQSPRIASRAASSTAASTDKWSNLKGRHFLTLRDYSESEIAQLLWTAKDLKARHAQDRLLSYRPLEGHSLGMIFEKRSTRTRSLPDTAKVLSGFCDAVLARVYAHDSLMTLSEHSSVPLVNGLSDQYHPLQVLADFSPRTKTLATSTASCADGDNNMTHSLMMGCPKLGMSNPHRFAREAMTRIRPWLQDARSSQPQYRHPSWCSPEIPPAGAVRGADASSRTHSSVMGPRGGEGSAA